MRRRSLAPLQSMWRFISAMKTASEWITVAAWLGLPGVAILIAFVNQQPLDVLLLYVMAAIAFWYVGKEEWRSISSNPPSPPICMVYEYPKCRDCACDVAPAAMTSAFEWGF